MNNDLDFWMELLAATVLAVIAYVLTVFLFSQGGPH